MTGRDVLRRLSRYLLPGWIWIAPTQAQVRIAIAGLTPDEPAALTAKRACRITAPIDRRER